MSWGGAEIHKESYPGLFNASAELQPGSAWIEDVFAKHEGSKAIPQNVIDWATHIMRSCYDHASFDKVREMVMHKVNHTIDVIDATNDIIAGTTELSWNVPQADVIAIGHDVGRFPQAVLAQTFSDKKSFYHAQVSARMVQLAGLPLAESGIDEDTVVMAIDNHSYLKPETDDPYALLIRDADKLALLRNPEHENHADGIRREAGLSAISEAVKKSFMAGECVLHADLRTPADGKMSKLAWLFDINYPETMRRIVDEGIADRLFEQLSAIAGEHDMDIFNKIQEWKSKVPRKSEVTQEVPVFTANLPQEHL